MRSLLIVTARHAVHLPTGTTRCPRRPNDVPENGETRRDRSGRYNIEEAVRYAPGHITLGGVVTETIMERLRLLMWKPTSGQSVEFATAMGDSSEATSSACTLRRSKYDDRTSW